MLFFGGSWYGLVFCSQDHGKSEWWCIAMTSHLHTWEIVTNDTMSHHIFIYINFFVFCSIFFIKIFSRVNICVTLCHLCHFSIKNIQLFKITHFLCYVSMSCFLEKLPNFFGKSPHIFWTLYTSDNDHSVKWYIFCTKQMLCCWWDFVKFPCRVSWIVTSPQPWYWALNANTSRFCGHTKSYLAPPFNEIIWNYPMISGGFWKHLNLSEYIWKYFDNFLKTNEIIWNYLMISGIVWNCHI